MTEVVKCPNCNAQLHAIPNVNILKCEYCNTEIIVNNNIHNFPQQMNGFPQQPNVFPQQPNVFPQQPNVFPQQPNVFPQQPNVFPQQPNVFPQQPNNFPQQVNNYVNTGNYVEDMKKWKKLFRKHLIIQAFLTAWFGIFTEADASGIGILTFLVATVYSFVLPFHIMNRKPNLTPRQNNQFLDFIKIYPLFAGAFWGGMILIAIILSINP